MYGPAARSRVVTTRAPDPNVSLRTPAVVFGAALLYRAIGYALGPIWLALIVAYFSAVLAGKQLLAAALKHSRSAHRSPKGHGGTVGNDRS
jgi:hypothetical protein